MSIYKTYTNLYALHRVTYNLDTIYYHHNNSSYYYKKCDDNKEIPNSNFLCHSANKAKVGVG